MKLIVFRRPIAIALLTLAFIGCGGGGSGSGTILEGTLTEAGGAGHRALKHQEGQRIGNVTICALNECSVTNENGEWGFIAPESFTGGAIEFSVNGHGIEAVTSLTIAENANHVVIEFDHVKGGHIVASHITTDGVTEHHEGGH